ncbi:MAG: hypothetical protein ACLSVD_12535 [Eggerthellaceae bacterium]
MDGSRDGRDGNRLPFGIMYRKHDYMTGEFVQMVSYYAADDDELRGLTNYSYRSAFGEYREEPDAAQTLSF